MKTRFALKIVANNAQWGSWSKKIAEIKAFYASVCDLDISIEYTSLVPVFTREPFLNPQGSVGLWTVDQEWYNQNISKRGTDLVTLVIPPDDHPGKVTVFGLMTGKDVGAWETTVYGNENDNLYVATQIKGNSVTWFIIHELSHAFYAMLGKNDKTHHFFNQETGAVWSPEQVLLDFVFPELPDPAPINPIQKTIDALKAIIVLLLGLKQDKIAQEVAQVVDTLNKNQPIPTVSKLEKFCSAIKEHEGWYPPSPAYPKGSRSYRNNNPANARYSGVGYDPIYGTVLKDSSNFAIFRDYATGWLYLTNLVKKSAQGLKQPKYRESMTIAEFFAVYAPASDGNDPVGYAHFVAGKVGVPVTAPIASLLS